MIFWVFDLVSIKILVFSLLAKNSSHPFKISTSFPSTSILTSLGNFNKSKLKRPSIDKPKVL